jgi:hypothetical protein
MRTKLQSIIWAGWCSLLLASVAMADQGRIEISQASFTNTAYIIRASGSYVLTENIVITNNHHGIQIEATNVTVDLNGFALQGPTNASRHGIYVANSSRRGVVVKNGFLKGWQGWGVYVSSDACLIEAIRIGGCNNGIYASSVSIVRDCTVRDPSITGIQAGGLILNCQVKASLPGTGYGIVAKEPCLVAECLVEGDFVGSGFYLNGADYARENECRHIDTTAFINDLGLPGTSGARVENNHTVGIGGTSFYLNLGTNIVFRNRSSNSLGEPSASTRGAGTFVAGVMTNMNPWANILY